MQPVKRLAELVILGLALPLRMLKSLTLAEEMATNRSVYLEETLAAQLQEQPLM